MAGLAQRAFRFSLSEIVKVLISATTLPLSFGGGDLLHGIHERLRFGQACQNDRRCGGHFGGIVREFDAGTFGLPAFVRRFMS